MSAVLLDPPAPSAPARDDLIPVLVQAADGLVIVWHTPEEYEALWAGVDREAAYALVN